MTTSSELNCAIVDYLEENGFLKAASSLKQETGCVSGSQQGVLEQRWGLVVRLQNRVIELEDKLNEAAGQLKNVPVRKQKLDHFSKPELAFTLKGHRGAINSLSIHPLFSLLASASEDSTVKIWDFETGEFEKTIKGHTKAVTDVCFDSQGLVLASCSADSSIRLWNASSDYIALKTLNGHDDTVSSICFTPSNTHLISGSRDKTIKVWEVATGYCTRTIYGHDEWVKCVSVNARGDKIVSCSADQTVKVFSLDSGDELLTLNGHTHVVESCLFAPASSNEFIKKLVQSPDQDFVISCSRDKTIRIWSLNGECVLVLNAHDNWISQVAFLRNPELFVSVSDDKSAKIWNVSTGQLVHSWIPHSQFVSSVAVGESLAVLMTGSADHSIAVWAFK